MAERSVSAMRAMFEAKGENTSPPSRGRSPAGSERSNGSRNVSTMRSSFVAVEKSGTHGPMLGLRRVSDAEQPSEGASPSQRGRNPISRTSSLSNVQEEDGALGNILKGSPFEVPKTIDERPIPKSVPDTKPENKAAGRGAEEKQQPAAVQKIAALAQGTVNKFKSTGPAKDQKSLSIATNKSVPKDMSMPGSARTPTSATRFGPAVKVSSPSSTTTPTSKPAPRKPTEPIEPKLSVRPSRPSLAAGTTKEIRAKSPFKPAPTTKPRVSDAASLRSKPSRTSLSHVDPEVLSRLSRPTQASANKTDAKADERKARQSTGKAPDEGFLTRMMRPTQASSSKHQEEEVKPQPAIQRSTASTNPKVLERLMKPTQSSSSKHEKEIKAEETKRTRSVGSKSAEPSFLERMSRPTAASQNKHQEKSETTEDPKHTVSTSPRTTKTQIAAAVMKPKQKLEAAKAKVEEKVSGKDSSEHAEPAIGVIAPGVAPEQTQADLESKRPTYVRVETDKAEGSPPVSAAAAAQVKEEEARAKRAVPVIAKEDSRNSAREAATRAAESAPTNGASHADEDTEGPLATASKDTEKPESAGTDFIATSDDAKDTNEEPVELAADTQEEPVQLAADTQDAQEEPVQLAADAQEEPVQIAADTQEEPVQLAADTKEEPVQLAADTTEEPVQLAADTTEEPVQPAADIDPPTPAVNPTTSNPGPTIDTNTASETPNGDWQSLQPENAANEKPVAPSLESRDTDIIPPSKSSDTGAGEAPGPALDAAAKIVQEAKEEAVERQEQLEGEGHPTDSLTEAVAKVH